MAAEVTFEKGLQLRLSRHLLPPGALLDCTNLAPDEAGILSTRKGMSLLGSFPGKDLNGYYVMNGHPTNETDHSYQSVTDPTLDVEAGGRLNVYRDFTDVLPIQGAGGYVDFVDMAEFQNPHQWTFFAAGQAGLHYKDDGTTTSKWGIGGPSTAPTIALGAAGNLNGIYSYRYIFVRHDGETGTIAVNWGNPSPESAEITCTNDQVEITDIINPQAPGPNQDLQVTHAYIFRTRANAGGLWFLVGIIIPFVTSSFTDNAPDVAIPVTSSLPSGLLEIDNGVPPVFSSITVHHERIWGVTGSDNRVYFSKRFRPEQFSATSYLEIGPLSETAVVIKAYDGRLYVGTDTRLIPILGNDESTYAPDDTPLPIGVTSPFTIAKGMKGLYWRGPDGVYVWNGSSATNITDGALYPIFHEQAAHGFPPATYGFHPFGPQYFSAGGWYEGRYYLSYAVDPDPHIIRTMVYDEMTETWYPDSRQFRRYFYARQQQQLVGTTATGQAYRLQHGTTDAGAAIPWSLQSRDIMEGPPQSDQSLEEVTLDLDTSGLPVTLTILKDFGVGTSGSVQVSSFGRSQQITAFPRETVMGKALGYRLAGNGPLKLYRLLPNVLIFPETRLAHDTGKTDLGYPGPKRIIGLTLDTELLEAGTITATLYGDGVVRGTPSLSLSGRQQINALTQAFEATILQTSVRSTGRFRLYPNSAVSWIPLPASRFIDEIVPTDLGYPGEKTLTAVWQDTELLGAGMLTPTLVVDGVTVPLLPQTSVGRRAANLLTTQVSGTLIGLQWASSAPFRRWPGSYIAWAPLPSARYVEYIAPSDLGYPGEKELTSVWLDTELLAPGTLTPILLVDGVEIPLLAQTTVGRRAANVLLTPVRGTVFGLRLTSTAPFRRWPGNLFTWTPLPTVSYAALVSPSDLGYPGEKELTSVWLDTELLAPGVLTPILLVDGAELPLLPQVGVGRRATNVLLDPVRGTIFGLRITSTAPFRRWPGNAFTWTPLPTVSQGALVSASDLGHAGEKRLVGVWLDTEVVGPGTMTPTLLLDDQTIPLLPQQGPGRRFENVLEHAVEGTLVGLRLDGNTGFRRWGGSYLAWLPLPAAYFDYHWPRSSFGTPNEKVLQWVSLDIELVDGLTAMSLLVTIDGTTTITFPLAGPGRRITGRLRFPRTAHGQSIEYQLVGPGRWRLWGGELQYQVLGSQTAQRLAITTPGGSVGPDVQKTSLDQTVLGPTGQQTSLDQTVVGPSGQQTSLDGTVVGPEPQKTPMDGVRTIEGQVQRTSLLQVA